MFLEVKDGKVKLVERQEMELKQLSTTQTNLVRKIAELEAKKTSFAQLLHERLDGLPEVCFQATGRLRNLLFFWTRRAK